MLCVDCRYSVDINFDKSLVNKDAFRDPALKNKARRDIKSKFEERLLSPPPPPLFSLSVSWN